MGDFRCFRTAQSPEDHYTSLQTTPFSIKKNPKPPATLQVILNYQYKQDEKSKSPNNVSKPQTKKKTTKTVAKMHANNIVTCR